MTITTKHGRIFVTFTEADFFRKLEDGSLAFREAIASIKEAFPWPESEYDGQEKHWKITDCPTNQTKIRAIKKKFFEDPNQEEMF